MKLLVPAVIFVVYMDYICLTVSGKDICRLPKRIGPCEALIPRWYYNYRTNRCVKFNYGGCRGNQNNFRSKWECMRRCPRTATSLCKLPKISGPCKAYFRRWYFNHKARKCERFVYGGCGGNKNNFRSLAACQRKCPVTTANICKLPKVTGPCRARIPRWYFNYKTKRCERFIYGGCRGNKNNFKSLAGCQRKCPERSCPRICYLLYAPVCGTDGKTYSNSCFLRIATCKSRGRITKAGDGPCLSNICKLPKVTGPCRARIPRWYFNYKTKRCERFIYGGCRGNKNNFKNLSGCQRKCPERSCPRICSLLYAPVCGTDGKTYSNSCFLRIATCKSRGRITKAGDGPCLSNICKLPKVTGPCRARIPRWYFNYKTKRCERFIYGGCRGNKNNFKNLAGCQRKCPEKSCPRICYLLYAPVCGTDGKTYSNSCFLRIATCKSRGRITKAGDGPCLSNICKLPKVTGPCRARIPRWYFNYKTKRCERFIYGGCRGNKNNFRSLSSCQKKCPDYTYRHNVPAIALKWLNMIMYPPDNTKCIEDIEAAQCVIIANVVISSEAGPDLRPFPKYKSCNS